ncbi:MAG: nitroreductase family protein [Deltaproteobacteria bacterium]|jgi:nitroreductase|nr:nitroreductase family protein [Deltaproteobacteria bacterium]
MFFCLRGVAGADVDLPEPQTTGGMGLFDALKKRSSVSGGDLVPAEVSLEDLSTILWAASGLNRGETGWTVPMAQGLAPYVSIHVVAADGVFLYDYRGHKLLEISKENVKGSVASQSFAAKASHILVFSTLPEELGKLRNPADAEEFACVLTGAMTQDVYLAAAALKLGARYLHSMKTDVVASALKLPEGSRPVALMILGK